MKVRILIILFVLVLMFSFVSAARQLGETCGPSCDWATLGEGCACDQSVANGCGCTLSCAGPGATCVFGCGLPYDQSFSEGSCDGLCGTVPADCGGTKWCGECCIPSCSGKVCGDDGCGGSCGTCSSGYSCSGGSCLLNIECGNGVVQTGEQCDDGNTVSGDGCDSSCQVENGWSCDEIEPSVCELDCQLTSSSWGVSETIDGNLVELNVEGIDCDGKEITFEIFENELIGRDGILVNPSDVVFSGSSATGSWVAEWIDDGFAQGNPEYVFKASLVDSPSTEIDDSGELVVLPEGTFIDCSNVTSCSNYIVLGDCVTDSCDVAEGSVEANNPLVSCGGSGVSCECAWISNSCEPSYTSVVGNHIIGTCSYGESTNGDDCEDSFLSYSWVKTWIWWHEGWTDWNDGPSVNVEDYKLSNGKYYYDPEDKFEDCKDGSTVVECPSQIKLGFFGTWNFIIAIIVLVGVYFIRSKKF